MIFINIDILEPNQNWLDRADALTAQLLAANTVQDKATIIKNNQNLWGELKQHFSDVLKRKCWYSESINDFAHCHLDHFRPKSRAIDENGKDQGGYWWLAFNWRNFRYAGPAGNVRKRDYFHVNANKANSPADPLENEDIRFLDPTDPDDPAKLKFNNEGIISPKSAIVNSREYIQSEYTIRRMNLNLFGLMEGRKDKYRLTARLIRQIEQLLTLQAITFDLARRQNIKAKQLELLNLADRYSEYSAAVKYCLRESGHEWALNIAIAA
ncbi:MAG: hypothetical protein IT245_04865 [Bacteroidia bacterium]|nr:hypothetical protein [Bacteroidia bacterium]